MDLDILRKSEKLDWEIFEANCSIGQKLQVQQWFTFSKSKKTRWSTRPFLFEHLEASSEGKSSRCNGSRSANQRHLLQIRDGHPWPCPPCCSWCPSPGSSCCGVLILPPCQVFVEFQEEKKWYIFFSIILFSIIAGGKPEMRKSLLAGCTGCKRAVIIPFNNNNSTQ